MPADLLVVDTSLTFSEVVDDSGQNAKNLDSFLEHHGIKGQKWGVRRYQNPDGSLTTEGRKRYNVGSAVKDLARSGVAAAGRSMRKAIGRQSDSDLDYELAKARKKNEQEEKKAEINRLNGKHKKLKDMTDQEVSDYLIRLQKTKQIKDIENEMNHPAKKFIAETAKNTVGVAIGRAVGNSIGNAIESRAKLRTEHAIEKKQDKWERKHSDLDSVKSKRLEQERNDARAKLETEKSRRDLAEIDDIRGAEAAKRAAETARNKREVDQADSIARADESRRNAEIAKNQASQRRSEIEREALKGNNLMNKRLSNTANAMKGNWGNVNRKSDGESEAVRKARNDYEEAAYKNAKRVLDGDDDAAKRGEKASSLVPKKKEKGKKGN